MEQKESAAQQLKAAPLSVPVISVKRAATWMKTAGGTPSVDQREAAAPQLVAALPCVPVLKEREIVKRTPNVPRVSSVAFTTAISMARLRTAAAPLLPGARPSVLVV